MNFINKFYLYYAAVDGKPFVTISSEHNISSVADILADKLIKQNGIYFIATKGNVKLNWYQQVIIINILTMLIYKFHQKYFL